MKIILTSIFLLTSFVSLAQSDKKIEIELYKDHKKIKSGFYVFLVGNDTTISLSEPVIKATDINQYSIRVCYGKHRLLIPRRYDDIEHFKVFLDRKSYTALDETRFSIGNPFTKYYFVDLGLNVMLRVGRTKKGCCDAI